MEVMQVQQLIAEKVKQAEEDILKETGKKIVLYYTMGDQNEIEEMVSQLVYKCCDCWGITLAYLIEKKKEQHRVAMRAAAYYVVRNHFPKYSLASIGARFKVDHTTVMHALVSVEDWLSTNDAFFNVYYKPIKHLIK